MSVEEIIPILNGSWIKIVRLFKVIHTLIASFCLKYNLFVINDQNKIILGSNNFWNKNKYEKGKLASPIVPNFAFYGCLCMKYEKF